MKALGILAACIVGLFCVLGILACLMVSVLDIRDWWEGRRKT